MLIEIPIVDDFQKVTGYQTIDLKFPVCVGDVNQLREKYKVFTENETIIFTKILKEEHYIFTRVPHSVCTDETETPKVLGMQYLRNGFLRDDVKVCNRNYVLNRLDDVTTATGNIFYNVLDAMEGIAQPQKVENSE
jgi:hypothetical protein